MKEISLSCEYVFAGVRGEKKKHGGTVGGKGKEKPTRCIEHYEGAGRWKRGGSNTRGYEREIQMKSRKKRGDVKDIARGAREGGNAPRNGYRGRHCDAICKH